ncbi:hypothetical protein A2442_00730 [Candidatus Campbellbacteria bacterium RIFOXYC2_FULL_35_25]|uniref:Reactive intermediate/imine deaminase n=1 Tax=Candidatus Campbellbacteria bacterium RIFOXYC2_FULL_35_25 TaxID=1797582 RepID=A0A1F5EIQ5_9BACT|nr:MAG: hypothetical protein A2442_00730 [Candidatus Campbellbacteria bacterium RIFOXYC2_FULL_35_25]
MIKEIKTNKAPQVVGPYSQAIEVDNFIFCSGQISVDPATGEIAGENIKEQTERVIENLKIVLSEAGSSLSQVVKTEVYLSDMNNFVEMNKIYAEKFAQQPYPARATIEVARLPKDVLVEISCIAHK